ncbi:MAG: hypothetical protein KA795_13970 [Burkholderiaceae bacterium]|nr:hypothetical protein [Burkholderiaceae bacterium]
MIGPIPNPISIITSIFDKIHPKNEINFKKDFKAMIDSLGVDESTRERIMAVLNSGKDQDLSKKLIDLVNGDLLDKNGEPIQLKDASGAPIQLDPELIAQLAEKNGVPQTSINTGDLRAAGMQGPGFDDGLMQQPGWLAG